MLIVLYFTTIEGAGGRGSVRTTEAGIKIGTKFTNTSPTNLSFYGRVGSLTYHPRADAGCVLQSPQKQQQWQARKTKER